jgi:hypothetical protein
MFICLAAKNAFDQGKNCTNVEQSTVIVLGLFLCDCDEYINAMR